jgi:hypothetical protein
MHIIHDANEAKDTKTGLATSIRSADNLDWSKSSKVVLSCVFVLLPLVALLFNQPQLACIINASALSLFFFFCLIYCS